MTTHDHDPERLERSLRVWLTEGRRPLADRDAQISEVLESLDDAPQTRARFLGRWFDRGGGARRHADARGYPPEANRRTRLMLSATGVTAAIALLAVTASLSDVDDLLFGAPSAMHVVAADGSGDFDTIQAAIDAAEAGETVAIRSGTYPEALVIDKDIVVTGQGDRSGIVISHSDGQTPVVTLRDSEASLSSLTLTGGDSQVLVSGGAPTIEDVMFDAVGKPNTGDPHLFAVSVTLEDGTRAIVRSNTFVSGGDVRVLGSEPEIVDNLLVDGPRIDLEGFGAETVVRGNEIRDAGYGGITVGTGTSVLIEGNVIEGAANGGIIGFATDPGFAPTIRGNTIVNSRMAIQMPPGAAGVVTENILRDNATGIVVRSDLGVMGNTIEGTGLGIMALEGAPDIAGNTIDVTGNGVVVRAGSSPRIHDNRICTPGIAIQVADGATPDIGENQSCE